MDLVNLPLEEARHLRKMAEDIEDRHEATESSPSAAVLICLHPTLRAALLHAEAIALERGYLRGRAAAAYEVRMGLDEIHANGGISFDSDTESPPGWLVRKAEKLARGNV
jgi:hypothetical protein